LKFEFESRNGSVPKKALSKEPIKTAALSNGSTYNLTHRLDTCIDANLFCNSFLIFHTWTAKVLGGSDIFSRLNM
jgi:hypothetical protein